MKNPSPRRCLAAATATALCLIGLAGVGPARRKALLRKFGSVVGVTLGWLFVHNINYFTPFISGNPQIMGPATRQIHSEFDYFSEVFEKFGCAPELVPDALGIWGEYAAILPEAFRKAKSLGLGIDLPCSH